MTLFRSIDRLVAHGRKATWACHALYRTPGDVVAKWGANESGFVGEAVALVVPAVTKSKHSSFQTLRVMTCMYFVTTWQSVSTCTNHELRAQHSIISMMVALLCYSEDNTAS